MSLLDRVSRAQEAHLRSDASDPGSKTRERDAASSLDQSYEELREGVQQHLSSFEMGALIVQNPLQARNEITHVCKRVFEERPWLAQEPAQRDALITRYLDNVFGLGPLEELLADASM